jgi:hypothetical protein
MALVRRDEFDVTFGHRQKLSIGRCGTTGHDVTGFQHCSQPIANDHLSVVANVFGRRCAVDARG